jgi:hypothetical protein
MEKFAQAVIGTAVGIFLGAFGAVAYDNYHKNAVIAHVAALGCTDLGPPPSNEGVFAHLSRAYVCNTGEIFIFTK